MAVLASIEYNRRGGIVILVGEDGSRQAVDIKAFDDPLQQAQILAAFDAPPPPPKTPVEKLTDVLVAKGILQPGDVAALAIAADLAEP